MGNGPARRDRLRPDPEERAPESEPRPCRLLRSALLFPLSILLSGAGRAQVELNFAEHLISDFRATAIAHGHFNTDGVLDFAIVEEGGAIILLRSDGVGGYTRASLNNSGVAVSIATGDIDGDGVLDLVYTQDDQVVAQLGFGAAQFGFPVSSPADQDPGVHLALVDLDQNGFLDVVIATDDGNSLTADDLLVLLGDGTGAFGPPVASAFGIEPRSLGTGRFDTGVTHDVLVLDRANQLWVYLGDGTGALAPLPPIPLGSGSSEMALGDVNEDGLVDVVTGPTGRVHLSDGAGGFAAPLALDDGGTPLVLGDWNGDGHLDGAFHASSSLVLASGDGTGSFGPGIGYGVESTCEEIAAADVDGDGNADIVSLEPGGGEGYVALFRGDGSGALGTSRVLAIETDTAFSPLSVDANGDGKQDYYYSDNADHVLLLGDGMGGFQAGASFHELMNDGPPVFGDFDGDGRLDLCGSHRVPDRIWIRTQNPLGGFRTPINTTLGGALGSLVAGDFDDDGNLDVAVQRTNDRVGILRGRGDGSFLAPIDLTQAILFAPRPAAVADFDENGVLDLLVSRRSSGMGPEDRMTVLLGNGNGGFSFLQHLPLSGAIHVTDFDADGHLDILVGGQSTIDLFEGTGTGFFQASRRLFTGVGANGYLTTADMNGDAALDVVTGAAPQPVAVLLGDGASGLGPPRLLWTASFGTAFAVADYDEDGLDDIVLGRFVVYPVLNRTGFYSCRRGNINGRVGPTTNVVFVNGSRGFGRDRTVKLSSSDSFELRIDAAPSGGNRFVLYGWSARLLSTRTMSAPGFGLGPTCMPTPLVGPPLNLSPIEIWKTIRSHDNLLGMATRNSSPAPTTLVSLATLGVSRRFFFQGFLLDPDSTHGILGTTNGVLVDSEE